MDNKLEFSLSESEKKAFVDALIPELTTLRAKAGVSQAEISNFIGTSRQTYGAIERRVQKLSWNTYLSLILFYDYNHKTHDMIRNSTAFPHKLLKHFNNGTNPNDINFGDIFDPNAQKILDSLDEQAISTIKTVLMLEYSRCNNITGEAVVKFFEGLNFLRTEAPSKQQAKTKQAVKRLKRNKENNE